MPDCFASDACDASQQAWSQPLTTVWRVHWYPLNSYCGHSLTEHRSTPTRKHFVNGSNMHPLLSHWIHRQTSMLLKLLQHCCPRESILDGILDVSLSAIEPPPRWRQVIPGKTARQLQPVRSVLSAHSLWKRPKCRIWQTPLRNHKFKHRCPPDRMFLAYNSTLVLTM